MRSVKFISLFLMFFLAFSGLTMAQETKEEVKKARKAYDKAKKFVYSKEWLRATQELRTVAEEYKKSEYLDDSLYWLSFSLKKLSEEMDNLEQQIELQKEALERLNQFIQEFSESSWLDDAEVLRIEIAEGLVKKGLKSYRKYINEALVLKEGVPIDVEADIHIELGETAVVIDPEVEIKLVALNALLNMDDEKAFPILVKVVKENEDPKLREKALFVLSQVEHVEVVPVLVEVATKDHVIEVRDKAIFWLGQREDSVDALIKIYQQTTDPKLREKLVFAFSQNEKNEKAINMLIDIAKNDKDPKIKEKAIFWLGQNMNEKVLDALLDIYKKTTDIRMKEKIIFSFSQAEKSRKILLDIAKNDKDLKAREKAIFWLGQDMTDEMLDVFVDLYSKTGEMNVKEKIIFSMAQSESDKAVKKLIEIAKKEKNYELKKKIIFWLGQSENEAAIKYLKEIIDK